jgi:hypothetical protein
MNPMRRHPSPRLPGIAARARDERGIALIIALFATILLTALGVALVLLTTTETMITANYRDSQQTLYAADAGVETAMQDLLLEADWNRVLSGAEHSGFFDAASAVTLGDGTTLNVENVKTEVQAETDRLRYWGTNDPRWQWYARGFASDLLPGGGLNSNVYLLVFVGDDPSETDGDPTRDSNGVVTLHVEAFGAAGGHKVIEVTVSRAASAEIERGYIAQRGQEELNQRARKAAVQTPGRGLTEMTMSVGAGAFAVQ